MKISEILKNCKLLCKIDLDEDEFDDIIKMFINDTLSDIYSDIKVIDVLKLPVINGEVIVDEGYQILKIEPALNIGDQVIGRTIYTKHKGLLDVYVSSESPQIDDLEAELEIQRHIAELIKYNVAALWYGFKKKGELSNYWLGMYNMEKMKRVDAMEAEETYEIGVTTFDLFNY